MALEDNQIMTVALVITEEQVLAMGRIDFLPIFQSQLDRRKRRMSMKLISEAVLLEEVQDLGYSVVMHHLDRLLA
jgi:hypothetical protein